MAGVHHRGRHRRPRVLRQHGRAGRNGRRAGLSVRAPAGTPGGGFVHFRSQAVFQGSEALAWPFPIPEGSGEGRVSQRCLGSPTLVRDYSDTNPLSCRPPFRELHAHPRHLSSAGVPTPCPPGLSEELSRDVPWTVRSGVIPSACARPHTSAAQTLTRARLLRAGLASSTRQGRATATQQQQRPLVRRQPGTPPSLSLVVHCCPRTPFFVWLR